MTADSNNTTAVIQLEREKCIEEKGSSCTNLREQHNLTWRVATVL